MDIELEGTALLTDPLLHKGSAFTEDERGEVHLHGLLPLHVGTLDDQRQRLQSIRFKRVVTPPPTSALRAISIRGRRNIKGNDTNGCVVVTIIFQVAESVGQLGRWARRCCESLPRPWEMKAAFGIRQDQTRLTLHQDGHRCSSI